MQEKKSIWILARWVFSLTFKLSPLLVGASVVSTFFKAILDIAQVYIFANIIGQIITLASSPNPDTKSIIFYLVARFVIITFRRLLSFIEEYSHQAIYQILDPLLDQSLAVKLQTLRIQTLESPEVQNKIQRARDGLGALLNFLWTSLRVIESGTRLLLASIGVFAVYPVLILINLIIRIPMYFNDKYFRQVVWKMYRETTESRRMARESYSYLVSTQTLHEIFLTGSFKYLLNHFSSYFKSYVKQLNQTRKTWLIRANSITYLTELYQLSVYIFVISQIINKTLEAGRGLVVARFVETIDDSMATFIFSINELQEQSIRLWDTYELFQLKPSFPDGNKVFPVLTKGPQIDIKNMSFSYPNSKKNIFDNFNLQIKSGEKIAIVGENGAGKTTLVKLLCNMYQVNRGEIAVNNLNLNSLKLDSYYKNLSVLFQEYNTYPHLTVKQNIAIGLPNKHINTLKMKTAALHANSKDFIEALPSKYEQILSERYKKGIRLSTGQWQKLAISRFFYRSSPLVIFDEPTAAIDAVAESKIFNRIYKFFQNKTVIIISHRFSTVRSADRIIVLDKGKIVEQGTHQQLLDLKGKYAHSFNLQAKGYVN